MYSRCVCVCVCQVSEVYRLHRETYHLAQDYFDRFMATQRNVLKSTLQLIGITCLFIAAKVEVGRAELFGTVRVLCCSVSAAFLIFKCFSPRRCILPKSTSLPT